MLKFLTGLIIGASLCYTVASGYIAQTVNQALLERGCVDKNTY